VFDGPVFTTALTYRGSLPIVPPAPDQNGYYAGLWNDYLLPFLRGVSVAGRSDGTFDLANLLPVPNNNYFEAQAMLGAAQLVPLLIAVSQSTDPGLTADDRRTAGVYAERVFNAVKDRMSAWLSAADDQALQLLYYQPNMPNEANATPGPGWQSLMALLPGFESSNSLNDHHLIGGYFIKTAALIARHDPTWGDTTRAVDDGQRTIAGKLGDIINLMIRDVSNYSRTDRPGDSSTTRPPFPFLRNFDVYQGHSWADGAANDPMGNNQESASEALNYASALIQWGEAIGDRAIRDLGVYLFTTEIESFNTYYFNVNQTDAFPDAFRESDPTRPGVDVRPGISKLNGGGSQYGGFIGLLTSNLAGIQMLPFTGGSYYLGTDPAFVLRNFAQAASNPTQPGGQPVVPPSYQAQLLSYLALADPDKALNDPNVGFLTHLRTITPVNPGNPIDSLAFTYNWIKVLQAYGQLDATVTADIASYAVFAKAGVGRTFVAYNPDALPRTVTFRDATGAVLMTMTVPGHTTRVSDATGTRITDLGTPDFSLRTSQNRFFFSSAGGTNQFLSGAAGSGESGVEIPAPGQGQPVQTAPTATNALTFRLTGVTGTYQGGDAKAFFSLWLDPRYAPLGNTVPIVRVRITYDPDGTGQNVVVHDYNNMPLSLNPGFANVTSLDLINVIPPYPKSLTNGTITFEVWAFQGNDNPIRLRTDAAAEQGRVSYLDLPYDFIAATPPIVPPVTPGPAPVVPPVVPGPVAPPSVPHIVGLTATPTVSDGRFTVTLTGTIVGSDATSPHALDIDWGDGSPPARVILAAGEAAFSVQHIYANNRPAGRSTVIATVTNLLNGLSAAGAVEVSNRPPTPAGVFAVGTGAGVQAQVQVHSGGSVRSFAPFGDFTGGAVVASGDVTGDGVPDAVVGAGVGGGPRVVVFDGTDGRVVYDFFAYSPDFRGGVGGVAVADVDGDGYADLVVGAGAGGGPRVKVLSGRDLSVLADLFAFEADFRGGVTVAAGDVDGDGHADLVVGAGAGGGPRVMVLSGKDLSVLADFFALEDTFRGGVNVSAGDVDGDGLTDVIVAAGFGGGPRVTIWDGRSVLAGLPRQVANNFVFEDTLRTGVYNAAGDLNGDGFADPIAGGGPGGGSRVLTLSGADLIGGNPANPTALTNFFAGNPDNRGGVRVAAKELDGDGRADLVVGAGTGAGSRVTAYLGLNLAAGGVPAEVFGFDTFPGFSDGVFVG
jgi:hypothetical protein